MRAASIVGLVGGAYPRSATADRGGPLLRCVTLMVPVDDVDPGRGSVDVAMIRVRPAGAGLPGLGYRALERSPCVAQRVARYFVEVRVRGDHAC